MQWYISGTPGIICRYIPGEDCEVVGINEIPGAPKDQDIIYNVPVEERIHVKQGYEMGFASPVFCSDRSPSKKPGLPYVSFTSYPMMSNLWKGTRVPMPHWRYAWYYSAYSIQITIESGKFCYRIEKRWELETTLENYANLKPFVLYNFSFKQNQGWFLHWPDSFVRHGRLALTKTPGLAIDGIF